MHLNNVHAKKRVAGPGEVARVLDEARVLEHLESRDFMPIADYVHVRAPCGNQWQMLARMGPLASRRPVWRAQLCGGNINCAEPRAMRCGYCSTPSRWTARS